MTPRANSWPIAAIVGSIFSLVPVEAFAGGGWIPGCPMRAPLVYLSNVEHGRAELGGWYINGSFSPAPNALAHYGGGGGGLRANCGMLLGRWFILDGDYRLAVSKYGNSDAIPDFGLELGVGFAGARWYGKLPGSFVFGAGFGASIGRPIWFNISASVYPMTYGRFMLKFSKDVRLQMEYRMSPISTQYHFYNAWVMAHDASIAAGYGWFNLGVRGRMEDIYLHRDPDRNHRSFWIGGFLAFVYY